jgi:psiF repeat
MATPSESEGAWVFVSHSNKDFARKGSRSGDRKAFMSTCLSGDKKS